MPAERRERLYGDDKGERANYPVQADAQPCNVDQLQGFFGQAVDVCGDGGNDAFLYFVKADI